MEDHRKKVQVNAKTVLDYGVTEKNCKIMRD